MARNVATPKHFVLTGVPGVGKTTLVKAIHRELQQRSIECRGFFTEEVRTGGRRIGFDVVTANGERGQLARVCDDHDTFQGSRQNVYKVGQYSVNLLSFEQTALPTLLNDSNLDRTRKVIVIDEIGKMEMFSKSFIQTVERLLAHPSTIIVATIPVPKGKPIPFVEKIRNGAMSKVYEVTRQNRDSLLGAILPELTARIDSIGDR